MAYSIVAHDPATGQLGLAVLTCNLAVGMWVPWAEGGVGAIATQAYTERSYGLLGLARMRAGTSAPQTLHELLANDDRREYRQVTMVDVHGCFAVHTGNRCMPEAGHYVGDHFSVQANMVTRPSLWRSMARAYEAAEGDLPDRLLAALAAGQADGGDLRGARTVALLVVNDQRDAAPLIDLRVDHHPQPLEEMYRLLRLHRAYMAEYRVAELIAAGETEQVQMLITQIAEWAPDEAYLQFLRAYHLAGGLAYWEEAVPILQSLIEKDPVWLEYLRRDAMSDTFDQPNLAANLLAMLGYD